MIAAAVRHGCGRDAAGCSRNVGRGTGNKAPGWEAAVPPVAMPLPRCGNAGSHAIPSPATRPPCRARNGGCDCLLLHKACPELHTHCKQSASIHTPPNAHEGEASLSPASQHHRHNLCCPCARFPTLLDCAQPQISRGINLGRILRLVWKIFFGGTHRLKTELEGPERPRNQQPTASERFAALAYPSPTSVATSKPTVAHSLE